MNTFSLSNPALKLFSVLASFTPTGRSFQRGITLLVKTFKSVFEVDNGEKPEFIRENFFTNRVIPLWNDLPVGVKEARTLNSFKAGFTIY